jgi:hypothetical protein
VYRASLKEGKPLSERKLAAMFGKTSRRWARSRMAEVRHASDAVAITARYTARQARDSSKSWGVFSLAGGLAAGAGGAGSGRCGGFRW